MERFTGNEKLNDLPSYKSHRKLCEAIEELTYKIHTNSMITAKQEKVVNFTERRAYLMHCIEDIMINIQEAEISGETPTIILRNQREWDNCVFRKILTLKPIGEATNVEVSFGRNASRQKFTLLVLMLSKIYKLLQSKTTSTRRELYYQNISVIKNQRMVDYAIRDICCLLEAPSWELGVTATSKGLVAGSLSFLTLENLPIDCMVGGGVLIPQDIMNIRCIQSSAKFILVVEKDAIFQKLLNEDALTRLGDCIMITGKGYPDVNTRLLVKRLWETLLLPIFLLVDADFYGIDIMLIYRFGSLAMSHQSVDLAVPACRWIGVHPLDIDILNLPPQMISVEDNVKLKNIALRPYITPDIKLQISLLTNRRCKVEIEAVVNLGTNYLTDVYLPNKICSKEIM